MITDIVWMDNSK